MRTSTRTPVQRYQANPTLWLLGISSVALAATGDDDEEGNSQLVREPLTGVAFERRWSTPSDAHELELLGMSLRCMMGQCWIPMTRAYAMGLYYDPLEYAAACRSDSSSIVETSDDAVERFERSMLCPGFTKSLRMRFVASIPGKHVSKGMLKWMQPRINDYCKKHALDPVPVQRDMHRFLKLFHPLKMVPDTEVVFTWHGGNGVDRVAVSVDGQQLGTFESPVLHWALFDSYLGSDPVSEVAKDEFVAAWTKHSRAGHLLSGKPLPAS